jgi:hypothetical protein
MSPVMCHGHVSDLPVCPLLHRYRREADISFEPICLFFKYGDNAVKAMTAPQDRAAQGAKISESFGGSRRGANLMDGH